MENASKALIMAAGVLIGILILSLAVYLFVSFGNTSRELHKQILIYIYQNISYYLKKKKILLYMM